MQPKRIHINRGSLSPFTSSAILQLMREFNRKEDAGQCLTLSRLFREHAAKLKKEPCRQPSKAKKRTEADKRKRAEAFEKLKAGTYIPVALRNCLNEPEKPAAESVGQSDERDWTLDEYKAWIASTTAPKPAQPFKTQAQIDYEANLRVSREVGIEKNEKGWDDD